MILHKSNVLSFSHKYLFELIKRNNLFRNYCVLNNFREFKYEKNVSHNYIQKRDNSHSSLFNILSASEPVAYAQNFLVKVHEVTGLPWWATIILTTVILRSTITFPFAVYQAYIVAKVDNITHLDLPDIAKEKYKEIYLKSKEMKWTEKQAELQYKMAMKEEWTKLIVKHNCHPVKATIPIFIQLPTWICLSAALRNIAYMMPVKDEGAEAIYKELTSQGFLWMTNLAIPDGTIILPFFLGLFNLTIIEIQLMMKMTKSSKIQRYATNFFRVFSIILVPISATIPSCLCLYWTTSSMVGLTQNLLIMSPRVRRRFGIPDTPTTPDHPYKQLAHEISGRFKRRQV